MTNSNSVIYAKSNGNGRWSLMAIVGVTIGIFIYGPSLAAFVPRCMAGTLLLHVGIDIFLKGVVESYGQTAATTICKSDDGRRSLPGTNGEEGPSVPRR